MSAKTKENFWMEFKVYSDIQKELFSIKINDKDLNINNDYGRRNLQYIMRHTQFSNLFQKKIPIYLKDAISQVYQEIDIESKPIWIKFLSTKKAEKLITQFLSEQGLRLPEIKKRKLTRADRFCSEDERNFYKQLKKKASIFKLDKAIIKSEDDLSTLVYLLDGLSILKNSVFFDLLQHWFETSLKAEKIDELIYHLKKKMGLIKPGPKGFSPEEVMKIIFRYEYLRRIFSIIKKEIKEPYNEDEAQKEWVKLEAFLKENNYFNIDKEIVISKPIEIIIDNENIKRLIGKEKIKTRYIKKDHRALEYLGKNWLKNNLGYFEEFFKYDKTEEEAKQDIEEYIKVKTEIGQEKTVEEYGIEPFFRFEILTVIKNAEPSELAFFILSKIYRVSKRQIRRVIDSNMKTTQHVAELLSRVSDFK